MSLYKEDYMMAATLATGAAMVIMRPWAFYVAAAIGTMVSDPEGMVDSAGLWRTDELETLSQELDGLKTQLQEQGTWEGGAFDSFEAVHTTFKNSITTLNEGRNNTSEAVDSTGGFYKVGAFVCAGIALGMSIFAMWKMAARTNPATLVIAETTDAAVGSATTSTMRTVLTRHGMAIGALTGLLFMIKSQTETTGKIFPTLEAIPTQMTTAMDQNYTMPFVNDGLSYEGTSGLMPKTDETLAPPGPGYSTQPSPTET